MLGVKSAIMIITIEIPHLFRKRKLRRLRENPIKLHGQTYRFLGMRVSFHS